MTNAQVAFRLVLAGLFLLVGCTCGDSGSKTRSDGAPPGIDAAPRADAGPRADGEASDGAARKDGGVELEISCADGTKPDLSTLPSCKALLDRLLAECCPNPKAGLGARFAGMVCVAKADAMCKSILDSKESFGLTCDDVKTVAECK